MKEKFVHVCFIIDESGSMNGSQSDVLGGFRKVIDEQKAIKEGSCAVSLYKFASNVEKVFVGKNVNDVKEPSYSPGGCTAMFDGIGTAIDEIGKWLSDMPEEERPEKNLIVIMTDGEENSSKEYSGGKIKEMIKEQEEKYNWSFMYLGTDITTTKYADAIGIKSRGFSTRAKVNSNYACVSNIVSNFRDSMLGATMDCCLSKMNEDYKKDTGLDMTV